MSRKRKLEDDKAPSVAAGKLFIGHSFYLHPAALSKTRRAIFERQIVKNGGTLMDSLETKDSGGNVLALVEDTLIDPIALEGISKKLVSEFSSLQVLRLSWLSKCLEQNCLLDQTCHQFCAIQKKPPPTTTDSNLESERSRTVVEEPASSGGNGKKSSFIERNKHKFVCARSSESDDNAANIPANLNAHIIDDLQKLATAYKSSNDTWRAFGYEKTISALRHHGERITSREQAAKIPQVGKKMADKIMEIVEEGSLRKVHEVCDNEKMRTVELFNRVWGAGPSTAEKWHSQGLRSLQDLEEKGGHLLSRQQRVGLRHFEDFNERIPRSECTEIYDFVKRTALELREGLEVVACGSYRRGKETCGDLDVLITHTEDVALDGLFESLLHKLREIKFLTDDLSVQKDGRQRKYLGVCRLLSPDSKHRRLDIIVVPYCERATALLYFTGSAHFNRSMRLLASKMGMSLSEHALVTEVVRGGERGREKLNVGAALETPSEESVFEHLGLPYRDPKERDH